MTSATSVESVSRIPHCATEVGFAHQFVTATGLESPLRDSLTKVPNPIQACNLCAARVGLGSYVLDSSLSDRNRFWHELSDQS